MPLRSSDDFHCVKIHTMPIHAITPRRGEQPAKVRHALTLLAAYFEKIPNQKL